MFLAQIAIFTDTPNKTLDYIHRELTGNDFCYTTVGESIVLDIDEIYQRMVDEPDTWEAVGEELDSALKPMGATIKGLKSLNVDYAQLF